MQTMNRYRPIPRVGDNLDRLFDLLDRARLEQEAREYRNAVEPYRALLAAVAGRERELVPA
jgi:hypothetical protein